MNVEAGGSGGKSKLSELNDVSISTPISDGQTLKYDSTNEKWINDSGTGGGTWGSITGDIDDQSDLKTKLDNKVDKVTGKSLVEDTKVSSYDTHIADTDIHVTSTDKTNWSNKQDKLTASTNITIDTSNNISATDTTYTLTQDGTDGHKIVFTPSTGTSTEITIPDNDTVTTVTTSGSGNAVTEITATDGALTVTKGETFLTTSNTELITVTFVDSTTQTYKIVKNS